MKIKSKCLSVNFAALFSISLVVSSAWAFPITGSYTDDDARVVYTVGTAKDDNPAVGLDFYAEGALTYDYSMDYAIDARAIPVLCTGEEKILDGDDIAATLRRDGAVSLTTTQTLNQRTGSPLRSRGDSLIASGER